MRITATTDPLIVQFKLDGRFYNVGTGEGGELINDGERTSAPFEEITLALGQSFDVAGELIAVRKQSAPGSAPVFPEGGGN